MTLQRLTKNVRSAPFGYSEIEIHSGILRVIVNNAIDEYYVLKECDKMQHNLKYEGVLHIGVAGKDAKSCQKKL